MIFDIKYFYDNNISHFFEVDFSVIERRKERKGNEKK